jgi:hypothetical protein
LYLPDRRAEQLEIKEWHKRGLHFVGDWHTHPEQIPRYSSRDLVSIQDCFNKSHHELNAFVLVIVGRELPPLGLQVTVHNQESVLELSPMEPSK